MDKWKQEATTRFPEFDETARDAWETPYLCWFDLLTALRNAYHAPRNEDLIRRIYQFAKWCNEQPRGKTAADDLPTCVAVCFYEHLPEDTNTLADMPRWFKWSEVVLMKDIFTYHTGEEGFRNIEKSFARARR